LTCPSPLAFFFLSLHNLLQLDNFVYLSATIVTILPLLVLPELTFFYRNLQFKYISPIPREAMMETLWLGKLSLRDQGISGNFWAWTGVRPCAAGTSP
jgi:hypothetical protein